MQYTIVYCTLYSLHSSLKMFTEMYCFCIDYFWSWLLKCCLVKVMGRQTHGIDICSKTDKPSACYIVADVRPWHELGSCEKLLLNVILGPQFMKNPKEQWGPCSHYWRKSLKRPHKRIRLKDQGVCMLAQLFRSVCMDLSLATVIVVNQSLWI